MEDFYLDNAAVKPKPDDPVVSGKAMMIMWVCIGVIVVVGIVLAVVFLGGGGGGPRSCIDTTDCGCDEGACVCSSGVCVNGNCTTSANCSGCEICPNFECVSTCIKGEWCEAGVCTNCNNTTGSCDDNNIKSKYACGDGRCKQCYGSSAYCTDYMCATCANDMCTTNSSSCNPLDGSSTVPDAECKQNEDCSNGMACCYLGSSTENQVGVCSACCVNQDCDDEEVCTGDPKSGWKWACHRADGSAVCVEDGSPINDGACS